MSATIIPFSRTSHEALQAYHRLVEEARPRDLMNDPQYLDLMGAAKERYFTLRKREGRSG